MGEIPWQRLSGRAGPPVPRCGTVKFVDEWMRGVDVSMRDADGDMVGAGGMISVRKVDIEVADVDIERARARRVVVVVRCIVLVMSSCECEWK